MVEHGQDSRKRSGAYPGVDLQLQIVEAIQTGLSQYHKEKDSVDTETVQRLREDMRDGFNRVNERLDRVDSSLVQGVGRFAVSDTKIARMEDDIKELKRRTPTAPMPVIREAKKEEGEDEAPVVSQKFRNAIWLGIAGSVGAALFAGLMLITKLGQPDPQPAPQTVTSPKSTSVTPQQPPTSTTP